MNQIVFIEQKTFMTGHNPISLYAVAVSSFQVEIAIMVEQNRNT